MELRRCARYRFGVPVIFSWKGRRGAPQRGKGLARDLSAGGIFLRTRRLPPVGARIELEILLPPLEAGAPTWRWKNRGEVLRVETTGGGAKGNGFAAAFREFVLRRRKNNR